MCTAIGVALISGGVLLIEQSRTEARHGWTKAMCVIRNITLPKHVTSDTVCAFFAVDVDVPIVAVNVSAVAPASAASSMSVVAGYSSSSSAAWCAVPADIVALDSAYAEPACAQVNAFRTTVDSNDDNPNAVEAVAMWQAAATTTSHERHHCMVPTDAHAAVHDTECARATTNADAASAFFSVHRDRFILLYRHGWQADAAIAAIVGREYYNGVICTVTGAAVTAVSLCLALMAASETIYSYCRARCVAAYRLRTRRKDVSIFSNAELTRRRKAAARGDPRATSDAAAQLADQVDEAQKVN
jgi:hypothetical protein